MKKQMKWKALIIIAIVAIVALILGVTYFSSSKKVQGFRTQTVEKGSLEKMVTATGTLEAVTQIEVGSQISGTIQSIYVDYNSKVKKGQLIAQIDPRNYESQLLQAKASLEAAKADVKSAEASLSSAKANYSKTEATIASAKANAVKAKSLMENSRRNYDRYKQLRLKELISQSELEDAATDYESARSVYDSAEADINSAKASLEAAKAAIASAETQILTAKAAQARSQESVSQAALNLSYTRIVAPVNGTVISKEVEVGQTVAASLSAPTLFVIAEDLAKMQVVANIDEADVGQVKEGQKVSFTVDAYPDQEFKGIVKQVRTEPVTQSNVVTYEGLILVDNPNLELKPGMTANISFVVDERTDTLTVPNAALRFKMEDAASSSIKKTTGSSASAKLNTSRVYVLDKEGKASPVEITTGITDGSSTEVLSGDLKEGDEVIMGYATPDITGTNSPFNPFSNMKKQDQSNKSSTQGK